MRHAAFVFALPWFVSACASRPARPGQASPAAVADAEPRPQLAAALALGIFDGHADVGTVLHPGSVAYDVATGRYALAGSGENMWFAADAFQFVWKRVSGDVSLTADISFAGGGGNEHRKAVLMVRQSLDADSPYADVALHGSGLTSLQYRDARGAETHEIQSALSKPSRLRIEKRGDYVSMALGDPGSLRTAGASIRVPLGGSFEVGLGVCAHDKDVVEKAVFSNVSLTQGAEIGPPASYSALETVPMASTDRRVVYVSPGPLGAVNWTRDGSALVFDSGGHLQRLALGDGQTQGIDTGPVVHCNSDHGPSPDSRWLAVSDEPEEHRSTIYVVAFGGGTPRPVTSNSPSYWHGWSPDGKTIAFAGERNGDFDVYAVPAAGGQEVRLTTAKGTDDGPAYSPDGKYIYFTSDRTGLMQIWRMRPDGREQTQFLSDDDNDWFPRVSPDGKWIAFVTFDKGVAGHPAHKDVMLRVVSLADQKVRTLARLVGGPGTLPSWSPDSLQVAFTSYAPD